jgi:hypothetical protein
MAEEISSTLKVITLMVAFAGLMATVCFGLCVLLINVVGRLGPSKSFTKAERIASELASVTRVTATELNVEEFCKHLKTMPETELLRFGQVAKYMCSPESNYGPPREVFVIQLRESRAEWRRRHQKSPLDESI